MYDGIRNCSRATECVGESAEDPAEERSGGSPACVRRTQLPIDAEGSATEAQAQRKRATYRRSG